MTIRDELIRTARWALPALGEAACSQVLRFLDSQRIGGGFAGRSDTPQADLYYTVFGLQSWIALDGTQRRRGAERGKGRGKRGDAGTPLPRTTGASPVDPAFLTSFGAGENLDFVHTCCLIRCWACVSDLGFPPAEKVVQGLGARLLSFRLADGGYSHAGLACSSAYGCFLALGATQDLGDLGLPGQDGDRDALADSISRARCPGGGYANPPAQAPSAPATAAALVALASLQRPIDRQSIHWLLACRAEDGMFRANQLLPVSDLLSTGTALHALISCGANISAIRDPMAYAVGHYLWSPKGGFRAHAMDEVLDCEYTFYGLLALGATK